MAVSDIPDPEFDAWLETWDVPPADKRNLRALRQYIINPDNFILVRDEDGRTRVIDRRFYESMSRVGVSFSPAQRAQIQELVERQRIAEAQRIILDELDREFL